VDSLFGPERRVEPGQFKRIADWDAGFDKLVRDGENNDLPERVATVVSLTWSPGRKLLYGKDTPP